MGLFTATFLYSLVALIWVDRWATGRVPFFSALLVILLLIASVLVISLLVQRLALLQVGEVMRFIGEKGRQVIAEIYPPLTPAEREKEGNRKPAKAGYAQSARDPERCSYRRADGDRRL